MRDIFGKGGSLLLGRTMGLGSDFSVRGVAAGIGGNQSGMMMATLWTPDMIPGAVWVDANNAVLSGSAVTAMPDKNAGIITASQATAANQPTVVTDVLNGEPVIQFDGNDFLSFGAALGRPANFTVFIVGMFASTGAITTLCGAGDSVGTTGTFWGNITTGRTANDGKIEYMFGQGTSTYSYGRSTNQVITAGSWFLCCRRYTAGQDRVVDRVNGAAIPVTKDSGTATSNGGTVYGYSLGRPGDYNGIYAANGTRIKGWVMTPNAISDADSARLEGYYTHLCGLVGLLPSDHPYKTLAPTV